MCSQSDEIDGQQKTGVSEDDKRYELVAEMVSVQREKIELAGRLLEVSQQENQRHYDFLSNQLGVQEAQNKRGYHLVWLIVGSFLAFLLLLMCMVFFGSEAQADNAMKILSEGAKALGGAGVVFLVYSGLKRLINR